MTQTISFSEEQINVKTKVWDQTPLRLTEHIATGEDDLHKYEISQVVQTRTVLIKVDDGQTYEITMKELCVGISTMLEMKND